jgi:ABC-2 type transport system permease protein
MKGFYPALRTEIMKVGKSKILWISILFFVFLGMMIGLLMFLSKHPDIAGKSSILGTKASVFGTPYWPAYLNLLVQMALSVGSIGSGIVAIWIFGREYSDNVIKDLLALPVSRYSFVVSKFIIILAWSIILVLVLFIAGIVMGFVVGLENWSWQIMRAVFINYFFSSLLTILLCTPFALIACMSRGYLLPVAFVILTLIVTQFVFVGIPGLIPWFPWAIPALFSGVAGRSASNTGLVSLLVLLITSFAGFAGTAEWWNLADQK